MDIERREFNVTMNGYADLKFGDIWKPLEGLKYRFNGGFSYVPKRESQYQGTEMYNLNGSGSIYNQESQTWTIENILSYDKDFDLHHIGVTAVYAAKRKKYQRSTAGGSMFPNDALSFHNLGTASTQTAASYTDLYTSVSQMGRINYSYDSRYLLTATVRRDGSSVFGPANKYGIFPAVALGWNIAREAFMTKTEDWLTSLKLRVSYGLTGNESIPLYTTIPKMDSSTLAMGGKTKTTMKVNGRMGNDQLKWESTKNFNIGVDFGLWNNRLNGTVDFYISETYDMLMPRNLPRMTGYSSVYMNMGAIGNTGVELTLNSKNIVTKDFTWGTTLVFATNKNKIKEIYGDGQDDLGNRWFIGHPLGVIYDYTMVGIWQEDEIAAGKHHGWDETAQPGDVKIADLDGSGKIDDGDRRIVGQTAPKWTGGLTNTFTYKDFALSIFFQTVQGSMGWNRQLSVAADEQGRRNAPAEIGFWTPENKSNEWRSLANSSNRHGYGYARDNSYVSLKDITLSYTLPMNVIQKMGIGGLQLYLSGRNLHTFTNWIGWDPEGRDDPRGSGDWRINYPKTRSLVFGLNLTL
jgi:TonB-linked SusC/RagA family outer membrane protein